MESITATMIEARLWGAVLLPPTTSFQPAYPTHQKKALKTPYGGCARFPAAA
jgi:hypothetical protein